MVVEKERAEEEVAEGSDNDDVLALYASQSQNPTMVLGRQTTDPQKDFRTNESMTGGLHHGDEWEWEESAESPGTARNDPAYPQDYFAVHIPRPASAAVSRSSSRPTPSTTSSSNSLPGLSNRQSRGPPQDLRRVPSAHSDVGRKGRVFHSKSSSTSMITATSPNSELPIYPDQSFAALQYQFLDPRPSLPLRSHSSRPSPALLNTDMSQAKASARQNAPQPLAKTVGSTPLSSPGLFSHPSTSDATAEDHSRSNSPLLHPAHTQKPKTTTVAEVDRDMYTGNKYINEYEILSEIGRGEHGKVKLGRRLGEEWNVAIKIVPRYSRKRRLGKLGAPEDETRREVAILKRARHPNVVALYEVIDDPNKNKVYLVLEYVEHGEIKWRKEAPAEILSINRLRTESESNGLVSDVDATEAQQMLVASARRRHEQLEQRTRSGAVTPVANWSLEHNAELDDDPMSPDLSSSLSGQGSRSNLPSREGSGDEFGQGFSNGTLAGSMYGANASENHDPLHRAGSIAESAASHMSSEFNFERHEQWGFVPALTMEECRKVFRDTLLGLDFLHFIGIIHRDIKPMNLLVSSKNEVKISDFGVSYLGKAVGEDEENKTAEAEAEPLDNEKELARTVGTPGFWAPELCYNSFDPEQAMKYEDENGNPKVGKSLDLWSLGITLFAMVYARLPFYETQDTSLFEAICKSEVVLPATRLKPVDTQNAKFVSRSNISINSNKRLDYELNFEPVPESVRDLIRRLLIKDPSARMTIAQAKCHPWVLEGIEDPSRWVDHTRPEKKEKASDILEVGEKEIKQAVVKRSIVERGFQAVKGLAGSWLGRRDTRKRASSAATSTNTSTESIASPSTSSGSTVGKSERSREGRRTSLRNDEIVSALKASRDNTEHPLAQSQTASPHRESNRSYFEEGAASESEADVVTAGHDQERRPRAPERSVSSISTADSIKTIRAPQPVKRASVLQTPQELETESLLDAATNSLRTFTEAATHTAVRLTSMSRRERKSQDHESSVSPSRRMSGDARAEASVAVSTASAVGGFEVPPALRNPTPPVDRPSSGISNLSPIAEGRSSHFQPPESSDAAFEHAQQINHRRQIQERQIEVDRLAAEAELRSMPDDCPPSPDDLEYPDKSNSTVQDSPTTSGIQALRSASTIASSEGLERSDASRSISNASVGFTSSASSPPNDAYLSVEKSQVHGHANDSPPEYMRTADTITPSGRPVTVPGKPLEEQVTYDDDDSDEENDSSEDEGIMLGGPK